VGQHDSQGKQYRLYPGDELDRETPATAHVFQDVRRAGNLSLQVVRAHDALWAKARSRLDLIEQSATDESPEPRVVDTAHNVTVPAAGIARAIRRSRPCGM
jgi:hypothetical protein